MKKFLFAIFILMFVCILAFFSCSGNSKQENEDDSLIENATEEMSQQTVDNASGNVDRQNCQHTFSKWETKKGATCKNEGSRYRYCTKCYKFENESIPKLTTHYYRVLDKAVEATCEKTGLTEGVHCEFCNTVLQKQEIIPKLEHTVVISNEVLPTCKTTGYTEGHYCTTCRNYLIEREVIPKLEHEAVIDEAVEPTCESSGRTEGSHCGVCGTTIVAQNRIELLPHNYGSNEVCIDCSAPKASYGLSYSLIGDNYYVNGIGTCTDTEIIIPSVYDGKKVVTISAGAFRGCTNIVSVEMSDNIRIIGSSAFEGCTSLKKIRLSSSVTTLASCVFKDCTSLTDVDFSFIKTFESKSLSYCYIKSVVIPDGATLELNFCRESNVESVYIGENINEIPVNAFWGCKKLKEVILAEGVITIRDSAFRQSSIEMITLPSTLKTIYENAFQGCDKLTTVDFSGAKVITYSSTFADCSSLALIKNWTGIEYKMRFDYALFEGVSKIDGMLIGKGWLLSCDDTLSGKITVPEGIVAINSQAFLGCELITEIDLPSTLSFVGDSAFSKCSALETVCFPEGVTYIGDGVFYDCNALIYIYFPDSIEELNSLKIYSNRRVTISIGENTKKFYTEFITNSKGQQIIEFRGTKAEWQAYSESLNSTLFSYSTIKCTDGDIVQVVYTGNIGSNATYVLYSDDTYVLSGVGELAYANLRLSGYASRIKKLVIGEGITKINKSFHQESTFFGCKNIEEIEFPTTLTAIDKKTFEGSVWYENFNSGTDVVYNGTTLLMVPTSLSGSFTVKEGTVTISEYAFLNCIELTEIKLPTSVKFIKDSAFYRCEKLESIVLHEGIEEIGKSAFSYCYALTELIIPSTVIEIHNIASSCRSLKKVVLVDASSRTIPSGIVSYCDALEIVIIGKGVENLPINTLNSCSQLKYVVISEDVTTVDSSAFLYVPNDVKFLCYSETTVSSLKGTYANFAYMYSESEPTTEGNFWKFDENGDVVIY